MPEDLAAIDALLGAPEKATAPKPEKEEVGNPVGEEEIPEGADEPPQIDYKQVVKLQNGDTMTVGELKDFVQANKMDTEARINRENEILAQTEHANLLLSYVNQLPPELAKKAAADAVADYQREMRVLADLIPEIKDATKAVHVKDAIYALAAEYGVSKRDIDQVKNAVTVKMLWDYARLKADIKAAKSAVKPLRGTEPRGAGEKPGSPTNLQASIDKAKRTRSAQDEVAAIDNLLRSKSA